MIKFVTKFIVLSIIIFCLSLWLTGFSITTVPSYTTVLLVAFVLLIITTFIKPIIRFFAMPINLLTFGLFAIVINALILLFVDYLIDGFIISNFLTGLYASLIISLVTSFLGYSD